MSGMILHFQRGTFRVRGDVVEIFPASRDEHCVRVEFFGDEIDRIREVDALTGEITGEREHIAIFPASHFVTREEKMRDRHSKYRKRTGRTIEGIAGG